MFAILIQGSQRKNNLLVLSSFCGSLSNILKFLLNTDRADESTLVEVLLSKEW